MVLEPIERFVKRKIRESQLGLTWARPLSIPAALTTASLHAFSSQCVILPERAANEVRKN
jgi:hypothetical protein